MHIENVKNPYLTIENILSKTISNNKASNQAWWFYFKQLYQLKSLSPFCLLFTESSVGKPSL